MEPERQASVAPVSALAISAADEREADRDDNDSADATSGLPGNHRPTDGIAEDASASGDKAVDKRDEVSDGRENSNNGSLHGAGTGGARPGIPADDVRAESGELGGDGEHREGTGIESGLGNGAPADSSGSAEDQVGVEPGNGGVGGSIGGVSGGGGGTDGGVNFESASQGEQSKKEHVPPALPPNVLPMLPREQRKAKSKKTKLIKKTRSLGSKDTDPEATWLKELLPRAQNGWWDVRSEDLGFVIKFRWREQGSQPNQTFPRISREQFKTLRESEYEYARNLIADRIFGHLDDVATDPLRVGRARQVASRLGVALGNDIDLIAANQKYR